MPHIRERVLCTQPLREIVVSEDVLLRSLNNLKVDKSPGIDGMHPRILRELAPVLCKPLTIIYQRSLCTAELPQQWKDAIISPIFKKGDRRKAPNYRPVSLTSIICKVFERMIVEQIINHVKVNALQCPEQHGFAEGRSTITNLLEVLNVWSEALMHGLPVDVVYMDYAKALDKVPHERLLKKVESMGIMGPVLAWIRSFLTGRRQQVRVNNEVSSWRPVNSGVPQGSVLGPTLFAIFVSDVPGVTQSLISMFADDTKLYAVITDQSITQNIKNDIESLQEWANKMQMTFHPDKCKVMHLGYNNPGTRYTMVRADGNLHELDEVETELDLGVTIDNKLKFSNHVNRVVAKANRVLGCVPHTFKYMTAQVFLLLYKSLVRPHLEYASCVWSPHLKKDVDAVE